MKLFNSFVTIKKLTQDLPANPHWYFVPSDDRLHLGDKLFLNKICCELNCSKQILDKRTLVAVTLADRMDLTTSQVIGLDFSRPIWLSPPERIRYELKIRGVFSGDIFNVGNKNKHILYCPEYASSSLRIVGLNKRLVKVLQIFRSEGFKVTYIGQNRKEALGLDNFITGISEGADYLRSINAYAFLGLDNYWMHIAADAGMRRYILQRRKLRHQNLVNHVGVLNNILSNNSNAYYL